MTPSQVYSHCLENGRNAELEKFILTDPEWAYPEYAYLYAKYVIKDRWIEAESIITTSSQRAYYYAVEVIKGQLPENMHNMMLLHADEWAKEYLDFINN